MIVHEMEHGHHRLAYQDGSGDSGWVNHDQVAVLGEYRAVTQTLSAFFPPVFKVVPVECPRHFLDLNSDAYWDTGVWSDSEPKKDA